MTELAEATAPHVETLQLMGQSPFEFVGEVKKIPNLAEKLPTGEIAYLDIRVPNKLTVIGEVSTKVFTPEEKAAELTKSQAERSERKRVLHWRQYQNHKLEKHYTLEEADQKEFAAIIVRTPSRSPENSYDDELALMASLIKERSEKVDKIIKRRHLGALIVVEDLGDDQLKGWRKLQMSNLGLVTTETPSPKAVDVQSNFLVTFARPVKERSAVDLTKGSVSGYMFDHFTKAIEDTAAARGLTANTTELMKDARASKFPPGTLDDLHRGGNVTYQGTDDKGNAIHFATNKFGEETADPKDSEAFNVSVVPKKRGQNTEITNPTKKLDPLVVEATLNPGRIIQTHLNCNKCVSEGRKSNLYLKDEPREMPDGKFKQYIARCCATHGLRWSTPAPLYKDALAFKKNLSEVQ